MKPKPDSESTEGHVNSAFKSDDGRALDFISRGSPNEQHNYNNSRLWKENYQLDNNIMSHTYLNLN